MADASSEDTTRGKAKGRGGGKGKGGSGGGSGGNGGGGNGGNGGNGGGGGGGSGGRGKGGGGDSGGGNGGGRRSATELLVQRLRQQEQLEQEKLSQTRQQLNDALRLRESQDEAEAERRLRALNLDDAPQPQPRQADLRQRLTGENRGESPSKGGESPGKGGKSPGKGSGKGSAGGGRGGGGGGGGESPEVSQATAAIDSSPHGVAVGLAAAGKLDELTTLLATGSVDLAAPCVGGPHDSYTLLHAAAAGGHATVVAALLEAGKGDGAALERRTKRGDTPLRLGATKGHLAACRALVAAGADPLAANQVG